MSRGFVKDGDQEEVPVVTPRAFLPHGMTNFVTPQGLEALNAEKQALIAERDSASGNETDRRITRNYLNAKLELLEERIRTAVLADPKNRPADIIWIGSYVTLKMGWKERSIRITGTDEADAVKGFISYFSPLAVALSGHREGESLEVNLPSGRQKITILSVSYDRPAAIRDSNEIKQRHRAKKVGKHKTAGEQTFSVKENEVHEEEKKIPEKKDNPNEILPIVNERGITIGRAARWQCHDGSKLLHPVVHLHLFNSKGEIYLQKRPQWKDIQPGKWDTAVGGHMGFGETPEIALKRETDEELGLKQYTPVFLKRYIFESQREKELVHVYKAIYDGPVTPSGELDGGRFFSREEIIDNFGKKVFTPNFESEFKLLKF